MLTASGSFMAVLVDSSLWVHQLRKSGDQVKRDRVKALLENGLAAWCPPVRLELWRGVSHDTERNTLRRYEALLPSYEISPDVWEQAVRLADRGRAAGLTVPVSDLVIFACAKIHGLDLAHDDTHFVQLERLDT
jgi:predicted nucleic acid-binding protein